MVRLTDANGGVSQTGNPALIKSLSALKSPSLVGVVEEVLPVVRDRLAITVDHNGRVVVLGTGWPLTRHIHLLWVAYNNIAIVLEGSRAGPKRSNSRARRFQIRRDLLQRLEVVSCRLSVHRPMPHPPKP